MKKIIIKRYNNFNNLSQECANQIISTVKNKKKITLVLPGGKSPKQLIKNLYKRNLPSNIKLILSDERLTSKKNKQNSIREIYLPVICFFNHLKYSFYIGNNTKNECYRTG